MEVGEAARELLAAAQRGGAQPGSWTIPEDAWLEIQRAQDAAGLTVADVRPPVDGPTYMGLPVSIEQDGDEIVLEGLGA